MKEVVLKYRPVGFIPVYRTIKRNIPDGWHEINGSLLQTITKFLHLAISETDLLAELFHINKWLAKKLNRYYKYKLFELFEFITKLNPYHSFAIKKLGNLKAPSDKLKGVTFGCFIFADTFYNDYCQNNKPEDLDKFISCLYRNVPFDENDIDKRAGYIKKIPFITRQAVFLNYSLIKQWLSEQYPLLFHRTYDDEEETKKKKKKTENKTSWIPIFESLVGDDIVNSDKYANLPVTQVLRFLNNSIKKQSKNGG